MYVIEYRLMMFILRFQFYLGGWLDGPSIDPGPCHWFQDGPASGRTSVFSCQQA